MTLRSSLSPILLALSLAPLGACAPEQADDEAVDSSESEYQQASSLLSRRGALAVAKSAPLARLTETVAKGGVGLRPLAAQAIVAHRAGPDGAVGTADDGAFATLTELDALPNVGQSEIAALRTFALGLPIARTVPEDATRAMTLAQLTGYASPTMAATLCGGTSKLDADYNGNGTIARWSGRVDVSLRLGDVRGVHLVFVEGKGLRTDDPITLSLDVEHVDGRWTPYGPGDIGFPYLPKPLAVTTRLDERGSAGVGFTTNTTTAEVRLFVDIVEGAFAVGGSAYAGRGGPYQKINHLNLSCDHYWSQATGRWEWLPNR